MIPVAFGDEVKIYKEPAQDFIKRKTKSIENSFIEFFEDNEKPGTSKLSSTQREVLVGLMLGDGHLAPSTQKHNRDNPSTYKLVILQSDKHKDYVFHLYEIFKELTKTPPKYYEFNDKRNPEKIYKRWSFATILQPCLRFYGQIFYQYDKINEKYIKVVPENICKLLTTRSLAYWYMDDGSVKWQGKSLGLRYCTDNFKLREVYFLVDCLTNKFKLNCSLQKKDKKDRIYVVAEGDKQQSYYQIKNLMYQYLIPSMLYKFPKEYKIKKKDSRSATHE